MGNKYKQKKSTFTDEQSIEKMPEVAASAEESDDDAPEEVCFGDSKDKALGELKQIKGTIKAMKTKKKLKRKNLQERNKKQKKAKLKDLDKLPDSVLQNLPSYNETEKLTDSPDPREIEKSRCKKIKDNKVTEKPTDSPDQKEIEKSRCEKIKDSNSSQLGIKDDRDLSFIPLEMKKTILPIKVVSLENPNQKTPVIVNYRHRMLYGANISRRPAATLFTDLKYRRK